MDLVTTHHAAMPATVLKPEQLATHCDPSALGWNGDANDAPAVIGQERAHEAIAYGIAVAREDHHVFAMGPPGCGKRTLVRQAIAAQVASDGAKRCDWVYVNRGARRPFVGTCASWPMTCAR